MHLALRISSKELRAVVTSFLNGVYTKLFVRKCNASRHHRHYKESLKCEDSKQICPLHKVLLGIIPPWRVLLLCIAHGDSEAWRHGPADPPVDTWLVISTKKSFVSV